MNRTFCTFITLIVTAVVAVEASAHARSESYSHWHLSGHTVIGTVTIPLREVILLYQDGNNAETPPRSLFHDHLIANIGVSAGDDMCHQTGSNILHAASGFVRVEVSFTCPELAPDTASFLAMFDASPSHVNYAKVHQDGTLLGESLFTSAKPNWNFGTLDDKSNSSFLAFLGIGIQHIAGGIDHIAFLFGLLLIAGSLGRSVIAVTGFTLGHSISLAAAVLGYVHAEGQLVEAFIGFTVALVAVEYFLLQRPDISRFAIISLTIAWVTGIAAVGLDYLPARALFAYGGFGVFAACYLLAASKISGKQGGRATLLLFVATCCFGLVHGFGFAGFLMETGRLGASLFIPLLGFNLGVELGQLIIVTVTLIAGMILKDRIPAALPQIVAATLCGIGIFWFVSRTLA